MYRFTVLSRKRLQATSVLVGVVCFAVIFGDVLKLKYLAENAIFYPAVAVLLLLPTNKIRQYFFVNDLGDGHIRSMPFLDKRSPI